MKDISKILYHRLVNNQKKYLFYANHFNLEKSDYNYKSIKRSLEIFPDELVIKAYKLFESKVLADKDIFKWNKKNQKEIGKRYNFSSYSEINENGESHKSLENFRAFYQDFKEQYTLQTKSLLQKELTWIKDNTYINLNDCVCFYCGINEQILNELYNDEKNTCKTKRNRGAWLELDRKDSSIKNNVYSKENMVLCCYFCNNHKSDVISSFDMRYYFGEPMFKFLMDKYKALFKTK